MENILMHGALPQITRLLLPLEEIQFKNTNWIPNFTFRLTIVTIHAIDNQINKYLLKMQHNYMRKGELHVMEGNQESAKRKAAIT